MVAPVTVHGAPEHVIPWAEAGFTKVSEDAVSTMASVGIDTELMPDWEKLRFATRLAPFSALMEKFTDTPSEAFLLIGADWCQLEFVGAIQFEFELISW